MSFLALFIPDKPAQTLLVCLIFSLTILLDLQTHFHFISLTFYWTGSFDCYKKTKKNQRHSEPQTAGRSSRSFHPCTEIIPFYSTELIANLLFITPVNLDFFLLIAYESFIDYVSATAGGKVSTIRRFLRTSQQLHLYWLQQWRDKRRLVSALINEVFIISCFPSSLRSRSRLLSLFCPVRLHWFPAS